VRATTLAETVRRPNRKASQVARYLPACTQVCAGLRTVADNYRLTRISPGVVCRTCVGASPIPAGFLSCATTRGLPPRAETPALAEIGRRPTDNVLRGRELQQEILFGPQSRIAQLRWVSIDAGLLLVSPGGGVGGAPSGFWLLGSPGLVASACAELCIHGSAPHS
jgi:hypothetical protein